MTPAVPQIAVSTGGLICHSPGAEGVGRRVGGCWWWWGGLTSLLGTAALPQQRGEEHEPPGWSLHSFHFPPQGSKLLGAPR